MNWIELLQIILICYVLSDLSEFISGLVYEFTFKRKWIKIIQNLLTYMLSCPKCFSFWFSFIFTGSLFIACLVAIIINIIKSVEYKLSKNKTEL
jgi:hypothetical protein